MDKLISKVKLILDNTIPNVYTQGNCVKVYLIMERREAGQSIIDFTADLGVPETLLTDGSGEFTEQSTEFVKHARQMRMHLRNLEQGRQNQNHAAEQEISFFG